MPIPKPKKNEKKNKFMGKCIEFLVKEGKPQDQAIAICSDQWDKKSKGSDDRKVYFDQLVEELKSLKEYWYGKQQEKEKF